MGNLLLRRRSEPGLIGWPAVSLIGAAFAITMLGTTLPTRPGAPVRVPSPKLSCCPWSMAGEKQLQGLVMSWTGAQVQSLDLRKRSGLGLGTRTGALGPPVRAGAEHSVLATGEGPGS
jgi:hypothetical protein